MVNLVIAIINGVKNNVYITANIFKGSIGIVDPTIKKENFLLLLKIYSTTLVEY